MRYRYAARVKNISFRYDSKTVLDSLCLDIFEGEWLSIVGSNGTGKSTLARVLACLSSPDEGRIEILGRTVLDFDAPADFDDSDNSENPGSTNSNSADFDSLINSEEYRLARRQIGFVMQNPQDQIIASVAQDDTAFGPENLGVCPEQITQRVEESLRETGMTAYRYSDPEFLSGGQQQRIAIAGSLAMRPKILILDEPTAMADEESRRQILQTLKNANESGTTIIHITHLLNELEFSSRTAIMHNGKIAQICSPEKTAEALKKLQSDDDSNADSGFEPNIKTNTESNIEKILKNEYTAVRIASGSDTAGSDTEKSNKSKTTAEKTAAAKSSDGSEIAVKINGLTFSDSDFSNTIFSAASLASPPAPPSISSAVSSSADSSPASSLSSPSLSPSLSASSSASPSASSSASPSNANSDSDSAANLARNILNNVSLEIKTGECVEITGQNGSGKSTLASLISCRETAKTGKILVNGLDLSNKKQRKAARAHIGYVMQFPEKQLFASTVLQDVMFGPVNFGLSQEKARERAMHILSIFNAADLAELSPTDLSGGQKRLVAIAGILACSPNILILDEPTSSLDRKSAKMLINALSVLKKLGITLVIISHQPKEFETLNPRIIDMSEISTPENSIQSENHAHENHACENYAWEKIADSDGFSHHSLTQHIQTRSKQPHRAETLSNAKTLRNVKTQQNAKTQPQNKRSRFAFRSLLSKIEPSVLLVSLAALIISTFFAQSIAQITLESALITVLFAAGGVKLRNYARFMRFPLIFVFFVAIVNLFIVRSGEIVLQTRFFQITNDGVSAAGFYALRITLILSACFAISSVLTISQIISACEKLFSPLERTGLKVREISLIMSLAVRFAPITVKETSAVIFAQTARGANFSSGPVRKRLSAAAAIFIPVFSAVLQHAAGLSLALDARCYESGAKRTIWHKTCVKPHDIAFAGFIFAFITLTLTLPFFMR